MTLARMMERYFLHGIVHNPERLRDIIGTQDAAPQGSDSGLIITSAEH
ncbi:MAG: hypothetical protein GY703_26105 [Gammaproteobacteria bacterium]|nr:hypothetical protein [Gammaproteobacteria bacterium]